MIASRREVALLKEYEYVKGLVNVLTKDDTEKKIVEKLRGKNVVEILDCVLTKNRRTRDRKKLIGALIRSIEFERVKEEGNKSWTLQFFSSFDCANVFKTFRQPNIQVQLNRTSRKPCVLNNHLVSCNDQKVNKTLRKSLASSSAKIKYKRKRTGKVKFVKLCEVPSEVIFLKPQKLNEMHPCKILSHTEFSNVIQPSQENSENGNEQFAEQLESIRLTLASETTNQNYKAAESEIGLFNQQDSASDKSLKVFRCMPDNFSYDSQTDENEGFSVTEKDRSCETEDQNWYQYKIVSSNFWPNGEERESSKFNIMPDVIVSGIDTINTGFDCNFLKETDDIIQTSAESLPNNIDINICLKDVDNRQKPFIDGRSDVHTSTNIFSNDSKETVVEKVKYSTENRADFIPENKNNKSFLRLVNQNPIKKINKRRTSSNEQKLNGNPFSRRKLGCQLL